MKKYCLIAFAFTVIALAAPRAFAKGALAIDRNHGSHYGWSINYDTQEGANNKAVRECGTSDCHVVVEFQHTCAAYAADQGDTHHFGWAHRDDAEEAKHAAQQECRHAGGQECVVRVWGCDK